MELRLRLRLLSHQKWYDTRVFIEGTYGSVANSVDTRSTRVHMLVAIAECGVGF